MIQSTFGYKNEEIKKLLENAKNYRFRLEWLNIYLCLHLFKTKL